MSDLRVENFLPDPGSVVMAPAFLFQDRLDRFSDFGGA